MGSLDPESDCKPEFDDSGCIQDESMKSQSTSSLKPQLLDLSDDVLLYILRHCSPMELKALGFTCPRLFALTLDHTLWQQVDARGEEVGPARLAWYLDHAFTPATTELLITGFARQAEGCLGVVNQKRNDALNEKVRKRQVQPQDIITADLRNNIITVTPSTSGTVGFRISRDNGGPNVNREGDVAQENGGVALENGNVAPLNAEVAQENGDVAPENVEVAQENGDIAQENPEALKIDKVPDEPKTNKKDDKKSINNADNGSDTANTDSSINENIQDAKKQGIDEKMEIEDTKNVKESFDSPKSKASVNCSTEKASDSNLHDGNEHRGSCRGASTSADAGPSGSSAGNRAVNADDVPFPPEQSRPRLVSQQLRLCAPWLNDFQRSVPPTEDLETVKNDQCPGPLFTFTPKTMKQLRILCPNLTSLAIDYCNINCQQTRLSQFPRTLKTLSLRGSKCYNLPIDKCFLFKIQDYMPVLEYLDVSECEWVEPSSILGLSKIPVLKHLVLRDCCRLTEFVAYASLACRYGFRTLEIFDLRGSPLGDSEVSSFSWIQSLRELYVSAARKKSWPPEHTHYKDDHMPPHQELEHWEEEHEEPDSKLKSPTDPQKYGESEDDLEELMENSTEDMDWQNVRWPGHGSSESRYVIISPRRRRAENREESRNAERENAQRQESSQIVEFPRLLQLSRRENNQRDNNDSESPTENAQSNIETERIENGSGDAGDDQGPSIKRRKEDPKPSSSKAVDDTEKSSRYTKRSLDDSDTSDDDSDVPSKKTRRNNINERASTSKSASETSKTTNESSSQTSRKPQGESNNENGSGFVRFRRNMNPEYIQAPNNTEPAHKILYVNVSRRLHSVYRLSMPVCTVINSDELGPSDVVRRGRNISTIPPLFNSSAIHLDNSSLVTDVAIRAFGESNTDNVNYIQIGPNGPSRYHRRPTRSNLRVLSVTGFRNVTDRSLVHLMTAAPHLMVLDLSRTSVTDRGVENFRSLRPECEVINKKE